MDVQELQEKYDELDNIINTLEDLSEHIQYYKEFKADFEYTVYEAKKELEEIEPALKKAYDEEEKAQNREYWSTQF